MSKQGGLVSEIFNGPVKVTFGGRVLGFTKDGVNVEIEGGEWEAITVDEFGEGWIDAARSAEGITVNMRLAQHSADNLVDMIDGAVKVIDGAKTKVTWGKSAGYRATKKLLRLHPIELDDSDKTLDLVIPLAFAFDGPTFDYETAVSQMFDVTFRGVIDPTAPQGEMLFSIGDETANADVTPPTITGVVPADGASGISTSTSVVVTFDESMDEASVEDEGNIVFFKADKTQVPFSLSYNEPTKELTITPLSVLDAATQHFVTVTKGVKDVAGNNLAADETTDFTTT